MSTLLICASYFPMQIILWNRSDAGTLEFARRTLVESSRKVQPRGLILAKKRGVPPIEHQSGRLLRASYSSSTRNTRSSNHSLWEFVMVPKYLVGYLVICAQIALRMCIFSNHSTFQEATPERASVFRPQLLPSFRNARRHWGAALCVPQAYEAPRSPSATPAMRVRAFPNERALRRARWFRGQDGQWARGSKAQLYPKLAMRASTAAI